MLSDDMAMLCSVVTKRFVHCSIAPHGAAGLSGRAIYEVSAVRHRQTMPAGTHTHNEKDTVRTAQ